MPAIVAQHYDYIGWNRVIPAGLAQFHCESVPTRFNGISVNAIAESATGVFQHSMVKCVTKGRRSVVPGYRLWGGHSNTQSPSPMLAGRQEGSPRYFVVFASPV